MKRILILLLILASLLIVSCDMIDTSMFEGEPDIFTIEYDSNGGSEVPSQQVYDGYTIKRPHNPTKDGWFFDGWYNDAGEKWSFVSDIVTSDMTLIANWIPLRTVSFDNGLGKSPESQFVGDGRYATDPVVTADGYMLEGWYYNDEKWNFDSYIVTEDITLTAHWIKLINITFDTNDDTFSVPTISILPNTSIEKLPPAVKEGASLIGWFEIVDHSYKQVTTDTVFTKDTTLVARWNEDSSIALVTLDANGGRLNSELSRLNCIVGERIGELPTPWSPQNATFIGWYDENDVRYSKNIAIVESISLTAKYQYITECTANESKEHNFSKWSFNAQQTCTEDLYGERYCLDCQATEINIVHDATGHSFSNNWSYDMLKKTRACYTCGDVQVIEYRDLNDSIKAINVNGEIYGEKNLECLKNGDWEETSDTTFCGRSNGELDVFVVLDKATPIEYFYLKGDGNLTYTVSVMYEYETTYTLIGISSFGDEARRFDVNGGITSIKFHTDDSGNGIDYWQEILLVG